MAQIGIGKTKLLNTTIASSLYMNVDMRFAICIATNKSTYDMVSNKATSAILYRFLTETSSYNSSELTD